MLADLFTIDIAPPKLKDYLLNDKHPDGGGKAKFLRQHGFDTEEKVKALLLRIIAQHTPAQITGSAYGTKYIVEGPVLAGSTTLLRTVWIVLNGENSCRFVTAYPL